MQLDLRALIGKLNHETRAAFEAAAGLCLARTHYSVEIEHYLLKLLDLGDTDFATIIKHFGIDRSRLSKDLLAALDSLKSGNARTPSLSPSLAEMLEEAWLLASLDFGDTRIRTGYTVLAVVRKAAPRWQLEESASEFLKLSAESLRSNFTAIVARSRENSETASTGAGAPASSGKTPHLDQYAIDLTARAREGKLDPVLGRDLEIRQLVDILTRRRQNNPILVGEAGVGKTAVAEGFALRVAEGDVPPPLKAIQIHALDLGLLQAGAGVKGEFENRLKGLIEEVKASEVPIILFIDEAHTMIGAGGSAGQNDAANLLKPALARGELRTIAATTWSEYKKYFEKDPALARRFQVVKVEEPSEETCAIMLRGLVPALERHHAVRILDDGLEAAVRFSHRYIADRQLPDKAVSVLDTACARLSLAQNTTPAPIEDAARELADLKRQRQVLDRESAVGVDHARRLERIEERSAELENRLETLRARWEEERDVVASVLSTRERLENLVHDPANGDGQTRRLRDELCRLLKQLERIQGEESLLPVCVDAQLVSQVISGWTGIPVGKMLRDEITTALALERHLADSIVGQPDALETISRRLRTSKAGIEDPAKPVGVFMLAGPSGVGKTETALALSDLLYGGERNVIAINMSEFQEAHTVSTLKGSPPGYVGYGEGGVLTEAVRRRPHSVVLLDEVEKAHPDVLEIFFQVFDKGMLEDGEGRQVDFKNTVIILTTNAGAATITRLAMDAAGTPGSESLIEALKPELDRVFRPAFLGRLVIVPFLPLRDEALRQIVCLKLDKIRSRLAEVHGIELSIDDSVIDVVASRCTEVESGARNIDNILTHTMLPSISQLVLGAIVDGEKPAGIGVTTSENGTFLYSTEWSSVNDAAAKDKVLA